MLRDYFSLAFSNLTHRGIRTWLTMLGIFIGIAAVVSLISLGAGLQEAITGQFASLSTDTLTISSAETGFGPPGATAVKKLTEHDLKLVEEIPGVKIAIPRLIRVVKIEFNKITQFKFIGSNPTDQEKIDVLVESLNLKLAQGRMLTPSDSGKIVIGNDFVSKDSFEKKISLGTNLKIQGKNFKVIGILEKASTFTLNSVVLMQENDLKDLLNIGDEIDIIVVKLESKDDVKETVENIERKFRKDRNQKVGEEDFSVQTPIQSVSSVNTILNTVNLVIIGIAMISLLIGGIGIANTMFTSVLERTKEIGVMKAIGARNKDILTVFIIEAGLLGLVGGIVGSLIGLGMAFGVASIANAFFGNTIISVSLSVPLLLGAIAFSFLIGIISGIVPALQASKLNPVEALRS